MPHVNKPLPNSRNSGLILEYPNEKDHIVGGTTVGGFMVDKPAPPVLFTQGHGWANVITKNEGEIQANKNFDSFSCTVFATLKALAKYLKCVYEEDIDLSESFTAVMSGVIPGRGNTVRNVLESVRNQGFLEEKYRPFTKETTQAQFFAACTAIQKTNALKWLDKYDIWWDLLDSSDNVPHGKIITNLKYTPLIVTGYAWASYYGDSGVYYDYNYTANHCFLIDDHKEGDPRVDLLANDSYRFDWNTDDPDHTELDEFVKPLSKDFRIWSAHRIYATRKKEPLTLYAKILMAFKKIARDIHGGLWFIKGGQKQKIENWTAFAGAVIDEIGVEKNNLTDTELNKYPNATFFGG